MNNLRKIDEMSFKECSQELEAIIAKLDGVDLELEERIICYKRGVELLKILQERLAKAEQSVEVLTGELIPAKDDFVE
ncbi:MAG: exodeoxyribonuclease VII small subunit [Eggerthellaceae bacterium]|nr:exodeoxyribonuclease VII small subunit [Eggerthellaceae bacterium]